MRFPLPHEPLRNFLVGQFEGQAVLSEFHKECDEMENELGRPLLPWEEKEMLSVARFQTDEKRKGYIPPFELPEMLGGGKK